MVKKHLGVTQVVDLSATTFFLSRSGYAEGTLFPWTVSDSSLMGAIECGIVKPPRVPMIAQNMPSADEMPVYRNLWEHIRKDMPKKGAGKGRAARPAQRADQAAGCAGRTLSALQGDVRQSCRPATTRQ